MATKSKSKEKKKRHWSRGRGVRPFWSGTLSFGLVNVPVHLYPAQRTSKVSMRMLAPDGTPLARKFHCPEHEREIHAEHLLRGFEVEKGEYVIVRQEELENLEPQKTSEIDLTRFVAVEQIPPLFFDRSYFLTPSGDSNKAYRLLAEAMEKSELAGIASFVMRDKEYLAAIVAERGILRAQTLRFVDEVRTPHDIGLPDIEKANKTDTRRFVRVIQELSESTIEGLDLEDPYARKVEKLVKQKLKKKSDVVHVETDTDQEEGGPEEEPRGPDLIETIRWSLSQQEGTGNGSGRHANGKQNGAHPRKASPGADDLADWTKDQLLERAREVDLEGRSSMTKGELLKALRRQTPA